MTSTMSSSSSTLLLCSSCGEDITRDIVYRFAGCSHVSCYVCANNLDRAVNTLGIAALNTTTSTSASQQQQAMRDSDSFLDDADADADDDDDDDDDQNNNNDDDDDDDASAILNDNAVGTRPPGSGLGSNSSVVMSQRCPVCLKQHMGAVSLGTAASGDSTMTAALSSASAMSTGGETTQIGTAQRSTASNISGGGGGGRGRRRPALPKMVLCSLCEKLTATLECQQCGAPFCVHCSASFHSKPHFRSHHVVGLGQLQEERLLEQQRLCPIHHEEQDRYCLDCDQLLCAHCCLTTGRHDSADDRHSASTTTSATNTAHIGHDVQFVSVLEKHLRQDLAEFVRIMEEKNDVFLQHGDAELEKMRQSVNASAQAIETKINSIFALLHEQLNQREAKLLAQTRDLKLEHESQLNQTLSKLQQWFARCGASSGMGTAASSLAMMSLNAQGTTPAILSSSSSSSSSKNTTQTQNNFTDYAAFLNAQPTNTPGRTIVSLRKRLEEDRKALELVLSPVTEHLDSFYSSFDMVPISRCIDSFGYICSELVFSGTSLLTREYVLLINNWIIDARVHCGLSAMPTAASSTLTTATASSSKKRRMEDIELEDATPDVSMKGDSSSTADTRIWRLLFKASQDGFGAQTFHSKCDQRGETLVLLKIDDGSIIGGYNPVSWSNQFRHSSDRTAFMFSLRHRPRAMPVTADSTEMLATEDADIVEAPTRLSLNPGCSQHAVLNSFGGPAFGADASDLYTDATLQQGASLLKSYSLPADAPPCFFTPGVRREFNIEEVEVFCLAEKHPEKLHRQTWRQELTSLSSMGFLDRDQNIELLQKHKGDLNRVVQDLVSM